MRPPFALVFLLVLAAPLAAPLAAHAQVSGSAFSGFGQSKAPIEIEADELEVIDAESRAVYSGNVLVRQGGSTIATSKMVAHYEGSSTSGGALKRIVMTGGVVAKSDGSTAQADTGSFDMASETVVLEGDVILSQGKNAARGCKLVANLRTNKARLTACGGAGANGTRRKGRVTSVFTPRR